ncbi:MAG TPA: ABC transporter substrate-binding protein, partial [Amaricoccus sp.]|nr:ABC transporter substrate-binding protein [Amaricoccus sp.]
MSMMNRLLAATAVGLMVAGSAAASTLVYCSEGAPEGFDPAPWTSGTTFDASSRTVYNRLIEFQKGSTETEPGLAESWETSEDGTEITFHLRPGVKFQTTPYFTPTREMNADDVVF